MARKRDEPEVVVADLPPAGKTKVAVVKTEPAFSGRGAAAAAIGASVVVLGVIAGLVIWSGLFDDTTTTTTVTPTAQAASPRPVETKVVTNDLATAQFTIAGLAAVGALLTVWGMGVGITEIVKTTTTAETAETPDEKLLLSSVSGAAALFPAIAEAAKGLGAALKGMKTSAALVLTGGLLLIISGVVAWQTIPDTNRNPTIEVSDTTTPPTSDGAGTTETTRSRAATTTEPTSASTPTTR